jgi:RHS repeat-associated protein
MRTYNPSTQADTLKLTYGFDADPGAGVVNNGNVMSWTATGAQVFSRTYTYDELNRLKTMAAPGDACSGLSWTYDIWGNRTHQTPTGGTCNQSQLTINTLNRIADTGYGYDAAGNLTSEPGKTYQFDAEGRMTSINGGAVASYVYDANGRRVRKTISGTTTEYVYDLAGGVIAEFQGTNWTRGYVYLAGQMLAQYENTAAPATTFFAHKDHLGSTRTLTKVDKSNHEVLDYLPYGEQIAGGSATSHKFTGKERDSESGLDNFGARMYASTMGRFSSADPITVTPARQLDPQLLNLYSYVRNNPLVFIDPTGMIIDTSRLSEDDLKKYNQAVELANQRDANGNLLHPELNAQITALQNDSRTFFLEGGAGLGAGTAGDFTITKMTADGKDFTEAVIKLDFNKVKDGKGITAADFGLNFNKFGGLTDNARRFAELTGHEFAHGGYGIKNPADAVLIQQKVNDAQSALNALPIKGRYPLPPDVAQKLADSASALQRTEKHAQQVEKIINGELRATQKR